MYSKQEYEKDMQFIAKINNLASRKLEYVAYYFGFVSCLLAHVMYLFIFRHYGVYVMAYFNIFSVIFYIAMIGIVKKVENKINLVYASIAEIIVHASLATVCLGWKPDFGMLLLMLIPIGFLMPNKTHRISILLMLTDLALYGYLRYVYSDASKILYNLDDNIITTILYFINFTIGSVVLIYITTIYTFLNHYTQCKLRVQNEQLRVMATIDPLTKLKNRRAINDEMKKVYDESKETGNTYVLAIGDIDDFKKINDTYGHDYGDIVLKEIAGIIGGNVPVLASVARWGGEEFLLVIPSCNIEKGAKYIEKILSEVRSHTFNKGDNVFKVTMTFGVIEGNAGSSLEKNISHADTRLYKGKNNGKNHAEYTD
ncbi:MAG: GGDEF domain-containing protein [Lachnospiraceae bacterium]|nr:GGDEF domain-containing protein [Lachnospiraceae bacterium]